MADHPKSMANTKIREVNLRIQPPVLIGVAGILPYSFCNKTNRL